MLRRAGSGRQRNDPGDFVGRGKGEERDEGSPDPGEVEGPWG